MLVHLWITINMIPPAGKAPLHACTTRTSISAFQYLAFYTYLHSHIAPLFY